ncbi:hypothetical protein DI53_3845 [Sphingobacterium deserti]|uniref:Alanyl-tRNA synthetase n=1 Tax=Sphingobacterium deserti TaxID=1229276 RepID=A0A0B8SYU0_9SPHI|nr:hypothetical protein DI53_3845 [Sphingobacterium deserti]
MFLQQAQLKNSLHLLMSETKEKKSKLWLKRAGIGAFMFFLLKGIAWLVVFALAAKSCT